MKQRIRKTQENLMPGLMVVSAPTATKRGEKKKLEEKD